jgi:heme exporter protein C
MLKFIASAWVLMGLIIGFAMPRAQNLATTPIAFFHVPMAVSMLLLFLLAAIWSVKWAFFGRDPRDDARSLAFAEVGFLAGLVALATGMIFAKTNWGAYWSWDPQQVGVLGTLLTYAALFALRGATDDDQTKRSLWTAYSVLGVLVACFGSYVYRQILPPGTSLHPNQTLTKSDNLFKFALWFNVIGYAMLLICAANVRARLEIVSNRLEERAWRIS